MRLRIEIDEADPSTRAGQCHGEVDRRGRLANATLLIGHGDGAHEKPRCLYGCRTVHRRPGSIGVTLTPKKAGFDIHLDVLTLTSKTATQAREAGVPENLQMPGAGADGPHWFAGCGMLVAGGFCYGRLLDESRIARESQNSPASARASDRLLSIRDHEKHRIVRFFLGKRSLLVLRFASCEAVVDEAGESAEARGAFGFFDLLGNALP
jgi:hypothetical protein